MPFSESELDQLAELDSNGFLLAPGENADAFLKRVAKIEGMLDSFEKSLDSNEAQEACPGLALSKEARIPGEILVEAENATERLYGFKINWVPGFFLSKGVGLLWGGCAISFQGGFSLFLIRGAFAKAKRWFIYDREELMAHELCHVARTPLADKPLEEHFAYQTAKSMLRRHIGNCFQTQFDAMLFIAPVFTLLAAQVLNICMQYNLPIWLFWTFAIASPLFLIGRNELQRIVVKRAASALREAGFSRPQAILFRSRYKEVKRMALLKGKPGQLAEWLESLAKEDLRWAVALRRFPRVAEGNQQ